MSQLESSSGSPWQQALKEGVSELSELLGLLELQELPPDLWDPNTPFPLKVPRRYVQKIRKGDPNDPLLRQILPLAQENQVHPGFSPDPLQESAYLPVPGLIHKYRGRVLITLSGSCAIHCRYCFRRHFPYEENVLGQSHWPRLLDYLREKTEVIEVILSGGDPLMHKNETLARFVHALATIPHLQWLRIHSRLLNTLPERVDEGLIKALCSTRLRPVMLTHINHPREIDDVLCRAVNQLKAAQIPVFNHSVLLRGVNDELTTLIDLQKTLFSAGIQPYYLYRLDRVAGSAHFEVDLDLAKSLVLAVAARLPGYMVPRFVEERPGAPAKLPIPLL